MELPKQCLAVGDTPLNGHPPQPMLSSESSSKDTKVVFQMPFLYHLVLFLDETTGCVALIWANQILSENGPKNRRTQTLGATRSKSCYKKILKREERRVLAAEVSRAGIVPCLLILSLIS